MYSPGVLSCIMLVPFVTIIKIMMTVCERPENVDVVHSDLFVWLRFELTFMCVYIVAYIQQIL
jgi:hypothetical protein